MPRRGAVAAALVVLAGLCSGGALAAPPVRMTVAFDPGASLGGSTALHVGMRIDSRRLSSPITEARVLYPGSLGVVSSGLGLASCVRPGSDFVQVIFQGARLGGCPPNSVMGYGTAHADVRLSDGQVIPEYAVLTVLAGPIENGKLELVAYVDGRHPFGATLVYAGEIGAAPPPFGGMLALHMPPIPGLENVAVISLVDMQLVIGSKRITYYEHRGRRTVAYHPDGIGLPDRCPKGGFRFKAQLSFQNGARATAGAAIGCTRLH